MLPINPIQFACAEAGTTKLIKTEARAEVEWEDRSSVILAILPIGYAPRPVLVPHTSSRTRTATLLGDTLRAVRHRPPQSGLRMQQHFLNSPPSLGSVLYHTDGGLLRNITVARWSSWHTAKYSSRPYSGGTCSLKTTESEISRIP
eukprot:761671-Rhodomonas_salina.3